MRAFGSRHADLGRVPYQPRLVDPTVAYYATGKYSTAIGYGVAVTAMQMLDAFATIANGRATRPPHLLDATIDAKGRSPSCDVPASTGGSRTLRRFMTRMLQASSRTAPARAPPFPLDVSRARRELPRPHSRPAVNSERRRWHPSSGFAPAAHREFRDSGLRSTRTTSLRRRVSRAPVFPRSPMFALQHTAWRRPSLRTSRLSRAVTATPRTPVLGSARLRPRDGRGRSGCRPGPAAAQNTTQTTSTSKSRTQGGTATATGTTAASLPSDPSKHT